MKLLPWLGRIVDAASERYMRTQFIFFLLCILPFQLQAREIKSVNVPETVSIVDTTLQLNGAGIRSKFFVSVYVGALYLPEKAKEVEAVLAMPGAKRISMHFLYDEVSRKKLVDGWNDGFKANHDEQKFSDLEVRLQKFNGLFHTVYKGDVITLDYIPASGTIVALNGRQLGIVEGPDFYTGLLKVWLGEEPADYSLKEAMLGRE